MENNEGNVKKVTAFDRDMQLNCDLYNLFYTRATSTGKPLTKDEKDAIRSEEERVEALLFRAGRADDVTILREYIAMKPFR